MEYSCILEIKARCVLQNGVERMAWDSRVIIKSGRCCIELFILVHFGTDSCTEYVFLIYRKNASLDKWFSSMLVKTGTPARFIAIAAPLWTECSPIWSGVNPSLSGPRDTAAIHSLDKCLGLENRCVLPSFDRNVFTVVLDLLKDKKQCVKLFYSIFFTGQSRGFECFSILLILKNRIFI